MLVHPLSNYLRQRNALWPQKARDLESPGHRSPAVLCSNTHDDGRAIFKCGLENVVVRTGAEAAHIDRRTADCGGCQVTCNCAVRLLGCHGHVASRPSENAALLTPAGTRTCRRTSSE